MACGCPVITSNNTSCPEISGQAALLVDPSKVKEISDAIDKLNTDDALRMRLKERGLKEMNRFSWKKSAQETLDVINEKIRFG